VNQKDFITVCCGTTAGLTKHKITSALVTLNNASNYRANGLLSDYIGWTNGLTE